MFTVAPAGIVAPFEPVTLLPTVAVTWSPTLLLPVHTFDAAFVVSVVPAGIIPTAPPLFAASLPFAFDVTVLPLAVTVGSGGVVAGAVVGAVLGVVFGVLRGTVRGGVRRSGVVARFVGAAFAGASGVVAGTSFNCGWTVVSRPANARSRFSVLSVPSAVLSGPFFASELHAPKIANAATAIGAPNRRVYFDMKIPPKVI